MSYFSCFLFFYFKKTLKYFTFSIKRKCTKKMEAFYSCFPIFIYFHLPFNPIYNINLGFGCLSFTYWYFFSANFPNILPKIELKNSSN